MIFLRFYFDRISKIPSAYKKDLKTVEEVGKKVHNHFFENVDTEKNAF